MNCQWVKTVPFNSFERDQRSAVLRRSWLVGLACATVGRWKRELSLAFTSVFRLDSPSCAASLSSDAYALVLSALMGMVVYQLG